MYRWVELFSLFNATEKRTMTTTKFYNRSITTGKLKLANETFLVLIISQRHIVPLPSEVLVASGLYCKILTLYKIIKLIQCTMNAWLLLRFFSFLRLFLFVYKNTNSSDVWSHWECLLLG